MTDEQLGSLFEAFTEFYWSVPVSFVVKKLSVWHPEVDGKQIDRVLKQCANDIFLHHCTVEKNKTGEREIVSEQLVAVKEGDYECFLEARIDESYCEYDEEMLFQFVDYDQLTHWDLPEINAIADFGKTELGLNDEWTDQLIYDCIFHQRMALCEGRSWVMSVLHMESFGMIQFRTIEQVKRLRELGNSLYHVIPNPVLRGWRPMDLDNPLVPLDDIPDCDEDIPDMRTRKNEIFDLFGGRQKLSQMLIQQFTEQFIDKNDLLQRKVGRNELCPCGSGKKYKKCCGR